ENGERGLFVNGVGMFGTIGSRLHAAELAHTALTLAARPGAIAIIGGGAGGDLAEVLRHPVARVYAVEIDPEVVRVAREFFGAERGHPFDDPRVRVGTGDGRRFLREAPEPLDAILVDFQDPYTVQRARFYSREFFAEARAALAEGGVLVMQGLAASPRPWIGGTSGGPDATASLPEAARLNRSLLGTLRAAVEAVAVVP